MSKDSSSSGKRGLLSKVVRFVSSPTTHWADLDRPESTSEISDSRLALKEMVERKRRNDFVRNREFDLLRKARRREVSGAEGLGSSFSFPPSSQIASTGGRERTLEKIDEIEKQMSSAWLKRKGESIKAPLSGSASLQSGSVSTSALVSSRVPEIDDFASTVSDETTLSSGAVEALASRGSVPAGEGAISSHSPLNGSADGPSSDGSGSDQAARKPAAGQGLAEVRQEPEIEEAAIRFANGDTSGAEAGLLELMRAPDQRGQQLDIWLTLFDFYRATGEQGKFDDAAIEFAGRFGRSAPQWLLGPTPHSLLMGLVTEPAALSQQVSSHAQWVAPSSLGVQSVAALNATLARHTPPWQIDWRYIKVIEPSALSALTDALQRWADASVRINFLGGERLRRLLTDYSPTDDRSVDPMWWTARLALLRVQGDMDEFELVALKYCVTYEVSPPAWQDPVNSFSDTTNGGEPVTTDKVDGSSANLTLVKSAADTSLVETGSINSQGVLKIDLVGELLGDAGPALNGLSMAGAIAVEFHCSQLSRVDFGAAGTLLNWAAEQQDVGVQIVFKHVNRLVAAFFGVVGVTEVAQVRLRKD